MNHGFRADLALSAGHLPQTARGQPPVPRRSSMRVRASRRRGRWCLPQFASNLAQNSQRMVRGPDPGGVSPRLGQGLPQQSWHRNHSSRRPGLARPTTPDTPRRTGVDDARRQQTRSPLSFWPGARARPFSAWPSLVSYLMTVRAALGLAREGAALASLTQARARRASRPGPP